VTGRLPARGSYLPTNGTRVTTRRGYHRDGPEVVFGGSTGIDLHCPTRTRRVMGGEQDPVHVTVPQIAPLWPLVDGVPCELEAGEPTATAILATRIRQEDVLQSSV